MADQETICIIPLRREILKAPKYQRTKKAVRAVRSYLIKRFKLENVLIGQDLNMKLHERGNSNPPVKVKVKVYKYKENLIADTIDAPMLKEEEKKKGVTEKIKETITGKKSETEEVPEEKKEEEKKEVLKHPPPQKEEKKAPREAMPRDKKAGEREMKKEIFSKTQKPKHEKKK